MGGVAAARTPLVGVAPSHCVLEETLVGVDALQGHKTLVIDGARPEVAGALFAPTERGCAWIRDGLHEVGVHFQQLVEDIVLRRKHLLSYCAIGQKHYANCQEYCAEEPTQAKKTAHSEHSER